MSVNIITIQGEVPGADTLNLVSVYTVPANTRSKFIIDYITNTPNTNTVSNILAVYDGSDNFKFGYGFDVTNGAGFSAGNTTATVSTQNSMHFASDMLVTRNSNSQIMPLTDVSTNISTANMSTYSLPNFFYLSENYTVKVACLNSAESTQFKFTIIEESV